MPTLGSLPSPQPGATGASNGDTDRDDTVRANPATWHAPLVPLLIPDSVSDRSANDTDDDIVLGGGGSEIHSADRHRPQGRSSVNDTIDSQHVVNKIRDDNFSTQPSWLKNVGERYKTTIRYLNVQGNKTDKLSRFLLEAKSSGCCFCAVSQACLSTGSQNFKAAANDVRTEFKRDWKVRLFPSANEKDEGIVVFTRGGWSVSNTNVIIPSRLVVITGTDPGRNPVTVMVVQGHCATSRAFAKEERKRQAKLLHKEMKEYVSSFIAVNDANDLLVVVGDLNAGLADHHRKNPASGQAKEFDSMFKSTTEWMKGVGVRSAEEEFMVNRQAPIWTYQRAGTENRLAAASKIDHAYYKNSRGVKVIGHDIMTDSAAGSDHFPLEISYEASSVRQFVEDAAQTTRLFDNAILLDEETMEEFNEALDSALRRLETDHEMGDSSTHILDVLTCFNTATDAVLARSRQQNGGGVRQRRQAKYLTKAVRALQLDIRAKGKSLHAAQRMHQNTAVERKELRALRRKLKGKVKNITAHDTHSLKARMAAKTTSERERFKLLRVQENVQEPIRCLQDKNGSPCDHDDVQRVMAEEDQAYVDNLDCPVTDAGDADNGDARWYAPNKFPTAEEDRRTSFLYPATKDEAMAILDKKLASGTGDSAPGWDGTTVGLMKQMSEYAWEQYLKAVNYLFMTQHVLPEEVYSIIKHIPKNDNPGTKLSKGWRPIALQPMPLKVASAIWCNRIERKGFFRSTCQKGWQRGVSCQNAQRIALNCAYDARTEGKGKNCFFGFVDAAKAFDSISHDVLGRTVRALGMHEDDARLLSNMLRLQNRRCFTARGLSHPKTRPRNGVAQGSSEGPSAFAWFLEPLLREIVSNHSQDGYKMGNCTISVVAYADDLLLVSETKEGLQRLFNVVGDFCKFSGLKLNMGKDKTAWMQVNGTTDPRFEVVVQDSLNALDPKVVSRLLESESYRYLGIRLSSKLDLNEEVEHRLRNVKAQSDKLLFNALAVKQVANTAKVMLQSISRYPGWSDLYSEPQSAQIDQAVARAVREAFYTRGHVSHSCVFLPKSMHGLDLTPCSELQKVDTLRLAIRNINSTDPQVRESTRHVLKEMRARRLQGRKYGAGLGYLLKFVDEHPDWSLIETGKQHRSLLEVPVGWLKRFEIRSPTINALCKLGIYTVEQCLNTNFYQWVQEKRGMPDEEKKRLGLRLRTDWRSFLALPDMLRGLQNTGSLDRQLKAEQVRLRGAEQECHLADTGTVPEPWPEMEPGVVSVLLATDGSKIDVHPEEGGPSAGAAFAAFRGHGVDTDRAPLTAKIRVCGKASSNRGEALALYAGMKACRHVKNLSVLIDSQVTMQGVAARYKGQFRPAHTANLDLYDKCATLLHERAGKEGFTFEWTKVKSHEDDTPEEHVLADELAGEAAEMPLPSKHLEQLEPAYKLSYKGSLLDDTDIKSTLKACREEEIARTLPVHLQALTSGKVNHKLVSQVTGGWLGYSISELLLRAKFGATAGVRNQAQFHAVGVEGFICPHCKGSIEKVEGAPMNDSLHGVQWLAHCLHDCNHVELSAPREEIQAICDDWMSAFSELKIQLTKAADIPVDGDLDEDVFYLDLGGLFAMNSKLQCEIHAFSYKDLVKLFEKLRPHLTTMFIGADRGTEAAAEYSAKRRSLPNSNNIG